MLQEERKKTEYNVMLVTHANHYVSMFSIYEPLWHSAVALFHAPLCFMNIQIVKSHAISNYRPTWLMDNLWISS